MLMNRDESVLLVVDVQERLLPVIHDWQRVLENLLWLVRVAQKLEVPVLASEQYPHGLGRTHADLRALIPQRSIIEKLHFSCVAEGIFPPDQSGAAATARRQVVVCGIESHVCVQQTALDLREQGRSVFVVADAVSSRDPASTTLGLERMRSHGVEVVSREMVAYEWLKRAGTPLFRAVSSEFLRGRPVK